jgi:hypothetical protein
MNWLLTIVLCAALVELVPRLPFLKSLKTLRRTSSRAVRLVTAQAVSDHWKERAMGAYARRTFVASITITVLLAVVLGAAALLVMAMDQVSNGFQQFIFSWTGLAVSIVFASLYLVARKAGARG